MSALVDDLRRVLPTEAAGQAFVRSETIRLSTLDAVPVLRPGFDRPNHLAQLVDVLDRAELAACGEGPPVFACFSAPSQTGKTTGLEVHFAKWIARHPSHLLAYLPYGSDLAEDKSRRIRDDVRTLGVELRGDSRAVDMWQTTAGGGLLARGIKGGITGLPGIRCLALDDLYKSRAEAESPAHRRAVKDAVRGVVFTRRQPHTSVIVNFTRWHVDDVIGWLESEASEMARHGVVFEFYRVPAVDDDGEPIVHIGGRTRLFWEQQRALMGEHDWWSLMMGLPRPREGTLFKNAHTFSVKPTTGQVVIGLDFAYSTRTTADYSTAVVFYRVDERAYVLDVVRKQVSATDFAGELDTLKKRYPAATFRAYIGGGGETGIIDFLKARGIYVNASSTRQDKFTRAQATAAAWNEGSIFVPEQAEWVDGFVSELLSFPGGKNDDQVDALVSAFDAVPTAAVYQLAPRITAPRAHTGEAATLTPATRGWRPGSGTPRRPHE